MSLANYFQGKSVLVTGAALGIGRALAKRLDTYGAHVHALSLCPGQLESLKLERPNINTVTIDLAEDWDKTYQAVDKLGPLNYVINNAAIFTAGSFMEIKPKEFDDVFNVNVKSIINVSQAAANNMMKAGIQGSFLNVSSISSFKVVYMAPLYNLTKASLDMMTKIMAVEFAPHKIRVNSVNPIGVQTDMLRQMYDALGKRRDMSKVEIIRAVNKRCPTGSFVMEMDEVVNASLFMLSPMAPTITGESLFIDGGYRWAP